MTIITSKANSVVKNAKKLHQKKYRKSAYLIEGWHLFEEAVQAGVTIEKIFALENYRDQLATFPQTVWVSEDILLDLADSQTPQGIVAVVQKEEVGQADFSQGKFLFLEDVQDPGNVGTIIRTADAAGFTGVIVSDKSADIYSLKTLRSMQGSHFHLPIYRMSSQALLKETIIICYLFIENIFEGNLIYIKHNISWQIETKNIFQSCITSLIFISLYKFYKLIQILGQYVIQAAKEQ